MFFDASNASNSPILYFHYSQITDTDLQISQADTTDTGAYTCNATNPLGSVVVRAYLTVTLRTRIILPPQDASVIKGSTALLQCGVTRDPSVPVVWQWFFGVVPLPTDVTRQTVNPDGSLQILAVRNTDIGTYTCSVTSSSGNDSASTSLKVIELPYPPSITIVRLNADSNTAVDVSWQVRCSPVGKISSCYLFLNYILVEL